MEREVIQVVYGQTSFAPVQLQQVLNNGRNWSLEKSGSSSCCISTGSNHCLVALLSTWRVILSLYSNAV